MQTEIAKAYTNVPELYQHAMTSVHVLCPDFSWFPSSLIFILMPLFSSLHSVSVNLFSSFCSY